VIKSVDFYSVRSGTKHLVVGVLKVLLTGVRSDIRSLARFYRVSVHYVFCVVRVFVQYVFCVFRVLS
jgi:hypothetical protein